MFTPVTWDHLPVTIPFARPAASWWLNAAATKLPASTKTATAPNAAKKSPVGGEKRLRGEFPATRGLFTPRLKTKSNVYN